MKLFLLRHAEATYDAPSDEARELTRKGEKSVEGLARMLKPTLFDGLAAIRHSNLVRAQQTAALFKEGLALSQPLQEIEGLAPCDPPLLLLDNYLESAQDLMLVGHNPHLSLLASALLTGRPGHLCVEFKKSGLLCLERAAPPTTEIPIGQWVLRWFIVPKIIP